MNQLLKEQESYNIYDVLNKNCMDYARYVLKYRCIPDLRDGCKPIHKRIVYSFYKNKLTNDKPRAKSCNACGGVLTYSPHGDASVYDACVRLANDSVNQNLIDGKGSFSSHTSRDVYAGASRYTEMRLAEITNELLKGIEKNNVDFVPTYDESKEEPTVLPASFPLILCNPNIGIGVGISSSIASFNISDVIDYTIKMLKGEDLPLLSPDFPTGGDYLYNKEELQNIHDYGRGKLTVRAKYHFEENSIVVTEIPYTTTREAICEKIIDLVKDKTLKEVVDVNDYTGVKGLNITIDLKKGTNKEMIMTKLFAKTPLQDNFSCNFNVLDNGIPKLLGIKNIIQKWIEFRKKTIIREVKFDLIKIQEEQHLLSGLLKIIEVIDDVIRIIKESDTDDETFEKLKSTFDLSDNQAKYIMEIKLKSLNKEWIKNRTKKFDELAEKINKLNEIITNQDKLNEVIVSQLEEVSKKYGKSRMTTIIYDTDTTIPQDALIEDYNCQLVVTQQNYVKKTLRYSESQKLKDGDSIVSQTPATNKSKLLAFTDKANCYFYNLHELPETAPSNLGQYLPSLLSLEEDEKIIYITSTADFSGHMYFSFTNGKVAKIPLASYQTKQNRSRLQNAYNTESPLIYIGHLATDVDFLSKSSDGYYFLASSSLISKKTTKNSIGVTFQKLHPDCKVVEFGINPLSELESRTCTYDSLAKIGKKLDL